PLFATGYGRVLLVKIGLLAGVAALGAWNWRRVRPALGSAPGAGRLRMSATAELVLGTLLLGATAILVALPAPAL
ncbi:MAG TPA: CopD family protein, partial [Gemmatimonadales bacterium]|nr:CopD family protein [Gemmatimonadales bacterium]